MEQSGLLYYIAEQYVAIPNTTEGLRLFRRLSDGLYYVKKSDNTLELFSVGVGATNNTLFQNTTDSGNTGAGVDVLYTNVIAAGKLAIDGQSISGQYVINIADNANAKQIRLSFGGQEIFRSVVSMANDAFKIPLQFTVIRTSATTFKSIVWYTASDGAKIQESQQNDIAGFNFAIANNFVLSGEGVADNDIVAKFSKGFFEAAAL